MTKRIEIIFTHGETDGMPNELGIDEDGRLYWNKQPVVTEQKISLLWWVNVSIIAGALSTMIMATCAVVTICMPHGV